MLTILYGFSMTHPKANTMDSCLLLFLAFINLCNSLLQAEQISTNIHREELQIEKKPEVEDCIVDNL